MGGCSLRRVLPLAAAVWSFVTAASPARADDASSEAAARAVFLQGRELAAQGRFAEACPKFEESVRLYDGIGARYNLADCYEKVGRVASAWAMFSNVAAAALVAGEPSREKVGRERAAALEGRLPRLVVNVSAAARVDGLVVQRGAVPVGAAQWGTAVPVDPGTSLVEARAPGHVPFRREVVAKEGQTTVVDVPPLAAVAPVTEPSPSVVRGPASPAPRIAAVSLAAAGVVFVGLGTFWGLRAASIKDDSEAHCDAADRCDGEGLALRSDARANGTRSTVAFVVGGATLAGAAVLWFWFPGSSGGTRLAAIPAQHGGSVSLSTTW